MSVVYFHSEAGEARLRGSERSHCNVTTSRIALALLALHTFGDDPIARIIPGNHYAHKSDNFEQALGTVFSNGDLEFTTPDGKTDAFTVTLNTIMVAGDDVLRLMARLHGQCEVHGYVEGPNRAWLADLMVKGRTEQLFRSDQGWEEVIALLRSADDQPVVTSYSVCESFPNPMGSGDDEAWYERPISERWAHAINILRSKDEGLEWKPENWSQLRFDRGVTAMELRAIADTLVKR